MTLVFPPFYIEEAVNEGVTTYTRRVDIYEADATTIWKRGVDVAACSVSVEMDRKERRTAELSLLNSDGSLEIGSTNGLWYDKVIRPVFGVQHPSGNWERPLGTFLVDRIRTKNNSKEIRLTCRDFSKKLQYKLPYTLSWAVNTPIENIISTLASGGGVGPTRQDLPLTGISTDEETSFAEGSDRWDSMQKVATAHGYDLHFDVDGFLVMKEFTDPFLSPPQYTFQVGALSNISEIEREVSDALIRNHIIVAGESPAGDPVWGEALNNLATSPTRIARLGYRTERYESSWVTSHTQATEVAERFLKVKSLEQFSADLSIIIVPWLDVNVTVEFFDPSASSGDPTRYLLSSLSFSFDLKPASAKLGRVKNVINADAIYPLTTLYPGDEIFPGTP